MEASNQAVNSLLRLGLSKYQAMVYSSLTYLGPSGVIEISNASGVPRTKTYEVLNQLTRNGAVEFQSGRPTIYRGVPPAVLIKQLTDQYANTAQEAMKLLRYERSANMRTTGRELVWTIKGKDAIRRKLSGAISTAKRSILAVETNPPELIASVNASLRSCAGAGISVRAISLQEGARNAEKRLEFVEYRRLNLAAPRSGRIGQMAEFARGMISGSYAIVIVDGLQSSSQYQTGKTHQRTLASQSRFQGVALLQRMLIKELVDGQKNHG